MTRDFETVAASGKAGTRSGSVGRRSFLIGLGAMTVSGCVATQGEVPVAAAKSVAPAPKPVVPAMYQAVPTERFPIPEVDKDGKDTLYRVHGTPEAWSIGKAVSSGCIRLVNQDIIHLHGEVRDGSPIMVIPDPSMKHLLVG